MASGQSDKATIEPAALANGGKSLPSSMADTLAKVRDLLEERYGIERARVEMKTELSSLGLDSLSLVECAFDLESSLHIALSDLPHELVTVGDLVHYVSNVR